MYEFASNSNYNALLLSFQHRVSHGIIGHGVVHFQQGAGHRRRVSSAVDPFLNPRMRNYGPAGYDRRQVFTTNFYYNLPKPGKAMGLRPLAVVTDNWELSGVGRMLTGAPITPGYSLVTGLTSPSGSPSETATAEVINPTAPLASRFGPAPEPAGQASVANAPWMVTSTAPELGNLGHNTMTGPGTNNWDLSLYRKLKFTERVMGQLRFETYNTFNHTQFNAINSTMQFNTKGQQINTAFLLPTASRPPRYVQLAFRLMF